MNTAELIDLAPFSQETKDILKGAIATRGKNKGYVKASPGSSEHLVWNLLISRLAPARVTIASLMLNAKSEEFVKLDKELDTWPLFTFALNACEPAFRWNLWAHRYDREKAQRIVRRELEKLEDVA